MFSGVISSTMPLSTISMNAEWKTSSSPLFFKLVNILADIDVAAFSLLRCFGKRFLKVEIVDSYFVATFRFFLSKTIFFRIISISLISANDIGLAASWQA